MTAAVTVQAEQGRVLAAAKPDVTVEAEQARMLVAGRAPAVLVEAEQARYQVAAHQPTDIHAEQARMLVAGLGAVDNKRLRAWGFSLDGHDFYVLTLGETNTLVYDATTDSWSKWVSLGENIWRGSTGAPWIGMGSATLTLNATTKVVAGDFATGYLWTLNPYAGYDEDIDDLSEVAFTREVVGGLPMRTRKTQPIGAAYLTVNSGDPQISNATFNLQTSTDNGKTWLDQGSITSEVGDYSQQFGWRALGLMKAPGMAFKITDNGGGVRIDSLEIR